jgi:hypothetical protein
LPFWKKGLLVLSPALQFVTSPWRYKFSMFVVHTYIEICMEHWSCSLHCLECGKSNYLDTEGWFWSSMLVTWLSLTFCCIMWQSGSWTFVLAPIGLIAGAVEHKLFVGSLNRQALEKEIEEVSSSHSCRSMKCLWIVAGPESTAVWVVDLFLWCTKDYYSRRY